VPQRHEHSHLCAGGVKRSGDGPVGPEGADGIEDHPHVDAVLRALGEGPDHGAAGRVVADDEHRQIDRACRPLNERHQARKSQLTGHQ
jgi:hypothetical protein